MLPSVGIMAMLQLSGAAAADGDANYPCITAPFNR